MKIFLIIVRRMLEKQLNLFLFMDGAQLGDALTAEANDLIANEIPVDHIIVIRNHLNKKAPVFGQVLYKLVL